MIFATRENAGGDVLERLRITSTGNVGISTGVPQARLDVLAAGSGVTDMAQIWRNSGGTIVSSMSATGVMEAAKIFGYGPAGTAVDMLWVSTGSSKMFSVKGTGEVTARKLTIQDGQSRIYNGSGDITIAPAGSNLTVSRNVSAPSFTGSLAPGYITAGVLHTDVIASSIAVGAVTGPNIVAGTITLDKLNQSSCTNGQVPTWSNTSWICANPSGVAGRAICWKTATTLGYCTSAVDASGACNCGP